METGEVISAVTVWFPVVVVGNESPRGNVVVLFTYTENPEDGDHAVDPSIRTLPVTLPFPVA